MAAEAQRAPRVARDQTSMSAAAAALSSTSHADALKVFDQFKFDNTRPFCGDGSELAYACLTRAHSLTLVVANLLEEQGDNAHVVRNCHLGSALDGIAMLMSLAAFGLDGIDQ